MAFDGERPPWARFLSKLADSPAVRELFVGAVRSFLCRRRAAAPTAALAEQALLAFVIGEENESVQLNLLEGPEGRFP